MSFEVLSYKNISERARWQALCHNLPLCDIYFYPEYVYLYQLKGDGEPCCFVYYESKENFVIYPFLKRQINALPSFRDLPSNIYDIITPYGYGGYLRSNDQIVMNGFDSIFKEYCRENHIISEFIRFHPLIKNWNYSPNNVTIEQKSETILVDLTNDNEKIWSDISSKCRNCIRKAIKSNLNIIEDQKLSGLDTFYRLYHETMKRVKAKAYYFFPRAWFDDMASLIKGNLVLFHAEYNDAIVVSSLFMFTEEFIHYHLSASDTEHKYLSANHLLLYEVALWAKNRGIKYFHLGGGYQPNDTVFKFKASFSSIRAPFYIGKVIHDHEYYRYLSERKLAVEGEEISDLDFFPVYRAPTHP